MSLHGCIVEVAREPGRDARHSFARAQEAMRALTNVDVGGWRVTGGDIPYGADACEVPCFGYDVRHADGRLPVHPEPAGVDRFFGGLLATDGHPPLADISGCWKIARGVRLQICSATLTPTQPAQPLERAAEPT